MATSITPAYYLMMIGASLTITSSIVMLVVNLLGEASRFFPLYTPLGFGTSFILTLLPGVATLVVAHLYYSRPATRLVSGLIVAILSMVSLVGIIGSPTIIIYYGDIFSGPPISFAGGIIGAFLSRTAA
jgi:hypothetical protein